MSRNPLLLRQRRREGNLLLPRKRHASLLLLSRVAKPTILFLRRFLLRFVNVGPRFPRAVVGRGGLEGFVLRIMLLFVGLFLIPPVCVTTKENRTPPLLPHLRVIASCVWGVQIADGASGRCAREDCAGDSHATVTRHCISEFLQKGARGSTIPRPLRLHWCNKCYMRYPSPFLFLSFPTVHLTPSHSCK